MSELINFVYDFSDLENLKWRPWIGKNYKKGGLLIVGESHYTRNEKDMIEQSDYLYHVKWGESDKNKVKFYRNLTKMLNDNLNVNLMFEDIAQYNLIQRPMPSIQSRPTKNDFIKDIGTLLEVIRILKPSKVIICGKSGKRYFDKTLLPRYARTTYAEKINGCSPVKYSIDGNEILLTSHPSSRGIDLTGWHRFINKFLS